MGKKTHIKLIIHESKIADNRHQLKLGETVKIPKKLRAIYLTLWGGGGGGAGAIPNPDTSVVTNPESAAGTGGGGASVVYRLPLVLDNGNKIKYITMAQRGHGGAGGQQGAGEDGTQTVIEALDCCMQVVYTVVAYGGGGGQTYIDSPIILGGAGGGSGGSADGSTPGAGGGSFSTDLVGGTPNSCQMNGRVVAYAASGAAGGSVIWTSEEALLGNLRASNVKRGPVFSGRSGVALNQLPTTTPEVTTTTTTPSVPCQSSDTGKANRGFGGYVPGLGAGGGSDVGTVDVNFDRFGSGGGGSYGPGGHAGSPLNIHGSSGTLGGGGGGGGVSYNLAANPVKFGVGGRGGKGGAYLEC